MTLAKSEPKDIGSAFDLLSKSYEIVKKNWLVFLLVNIPLIIFSIGSYDPKDPAGLKASQNPEPFPDLTSTEVGLAVGLVALAVVIGIFFYSLMINLAVKASKGQKPTFDSLIPDGKKFALPLFGQLVLMISIIIIGFLLLIVPGIFAIQRLMLAPYILVNENLSVWESMKRSRALAKEYSGKVWALLGVSIVVGFITGFIQIIPIIGLAIGIALGIAWSLIAPLRYLQLKSL